MNLLSTILPLLGEGSQFAFTVARTKDALRVVTTPTLANFTPDTDDAELAALQAALAMPLVFTIPLDTDPDATLAELLTKAGELRQPTIDRLAAYQDAQREARNTAQIERDKKTTKTPVKTDSKSPAKSNTKPTDKTKPATKPPVTVGALTASSNGTDADTLDDESADANEAGSTPPAESHSAPVAEGIRLFD